MGEMPQHACSDYRLAAGFGLAQSQNPAEAGTPNAVHSNEICFSGPNTSLSPDAILQERG